MKKIIDKILSHLKTDKYRGLEVLVSTVDGVPLEHNLGSEENADDLAAISSAMWSFGKKINQQKEFAYQSIEVDTKDFVFIIVGFFEDVFCLLKVPHGNNIDKKALVNESRIALEKIAAVA